MRPLYLSPRACVRTRLIASTAVILGPSYIDEDTIVDHNVVIGYPSRRRLRETIRDAEASLDLYELLDKASRGSRVGACCHIRPGTVVYEDVVIGNNVETGHSVVIREGTTIGNNTVIGTASIIDGGVSIGNNVRIETGVYIPPESVIEDNVFLGPFVVITNDRYPPSKRLCGVYIEEGAVIGANSVLVAGIRIGRRAVVAAGSVVTKNVPPETVVAGVPAKPIATRDRFEEKKRLWEMEALGWRG